MGKSGWQSSVGGNTSGCVGGCFQTNIVQLEVTIYFVLETPT